VLAEFDAKTKAGLNPEPFLLRKAGKASTTPPRWTWASCWATRTTSARTSTPTSRASRRRRATSSSASISITQVERLAKANLLYLVTEKFANIDLHPSVVDNASMGAGVRGADSQVRRNLNETAGEHFTPREVIRLMVNLLFIEDDDVLTPGNAVVRTIYDPTAGTGGMLSVAGEYLLEHNPQARLTMFGQELNDESYAICKADMLIKGQDVEQHRRRQHAQRRRPRRAQVRLHAVQPAVRRGVEEGRKGGPQEHEQKGFDGRFGPGLPRVSDGSMLFLLHLLAKMRPAQDGGSRFGIVLNGSPLFTGGAGSGESEIRRYVLENDLVEAIVGLPTDMFYNTGISTYVWILSNKKPEDRRGWVQLIDASGFWQKMRKSLGSKRKEMSDAHIATSPACSAASPRPSRSPSRRRRPGGGRARAGHQYRHQPTAPEGGRLKRVPIARIFRNEDFGYTTITVERPLRDEAGHVVLGLKGKQKGKPQPDSALRDTENVPLAEDIGAYFKREVLPHAPDAWIDGEKSKVGYEIPFNRHFYVFEPPRSLHAIDEELKDRHGQHHEDAGGAGGRAGSRTSPDPTTASASQTATVWTSACWCPSPTTSPWSAITAPTTAACGTAGSRCASPCR
jgi:type I restriction enzyme M protein